MYAPLCNIISKNQIIAMLSSVWNNIKKLWSLLKVLLSLYYYMCHHICPIYAWTRQFFLLIICRYIKQISHCFISIYIFLGNFHKIYILQFILNFIKLYIQFWNLQFSHNFFFEPARPWIYIKNAGPGLYIKYTAQHISFVITYIAIHNSQYWLYIIDNDLILMLC